MDPADIAVVFDELKEEFYIFSKISTWIYDIHFVCGT